MNKIMPHYTNPCEVPSNEYKNSLYLQILNYTQLLPAPKYLQQQ